MVLAARWTRLGIQLRFETSELNEIESNVSQRGSKVDHCFTGVLEAWKHTKPEEFNKETLVRALRRIDEKGLADRVEKMVSGFHYYLHGPLYWSFLVSRN